MQPLRSALLKHPLLAVAVLLAALALRLAVPAGFMPVLTGGGPALAICPDQGPVAAAPSGETAAPMHGMAHHGEAGDEDGETGGDAARSPCAFADLSLPAIGGADPVQLAAALALVALAAILGRAAPPPRSASHLRPPTRGPPLQG